MEFGRVPEAELNSIDFLLPAEPDFNKAVLQWKAVTNPKIYLGCAKWGRTEWVGKIYPLKTKEKDFLQHYVNHYNSIELNATHYKVYNKASIKKWAEKSADKDFIFCPKMYKGVTHFGSLNGKQALTDEFLKGVLAFGKHLGPIFIQVSESFSPNRKQDLFDYLKGLPKDLQFFVEVRHPEWFSKPTIFQELVATLKALHIGIVITDTAGRRDCVHMYLTVPKVYIRYVGNSLHASDYTRCDAWIQRMKYWLDNGVEEIYFILHMGRENKEPEIAKYLAQKCSEILKIVIPVPEFIPVN